MKKVVNCAAVFLLLVLLQSWEAMAAEKTIQLTDISSALSGDGGFKIKLSLDLEPMGDKSHQAINSNTQEIRKIISAYLSQKTFEDLKSVQAKFALKEEVLKVINAFFGYPAVEGLFIIDMEISK